MRGFLAPGEEVRLAARLHGAALGLPLARALFVALAGAGLVILGAPIAWPLGALGALALAFGALIALAAVWRWDRTELVLTTEKLLVVYGIVHRRAAAVRLTGSGPIEVSQGPLGRVLGYGTITAGEVEIPFVPEPRRFCRPVG